jgi:hypothetical protein
MKAKTESNKRAKHGDVDAGRAPCLQVSRCWAAATPRDCRAALRFMRIQYAIVLCLILGAGAFVGRGQVSSPSAPFVVAVTNISSANIHVWSNTVSFHFAAAGVVNVDGLDQELARSGIRSKRLIRIMDRTNVIAEGRLLGRSWGLDTDGFLLSFDSPATAQKAAALLYDKGTLVFPKSRKGITY